MIPTLRWRHYQIAAVMWPVLAALSLSVAGAVLVPSGSRPAWLILCALTIAGTALPIALAALTGAAVFMVYGTWLFAAGAVHAVHGSELVGLGLMPFAPLWLAAVRNRQREQALLQALLELPQVRAAMDVRPWTLLPAARALMNRLRIHFAMRDATPVILLRLTIEAWHEVHRLLGANQARREIFRLIEALRLSLRDGDWIADDLSKGQCLYLLIFPNPEKLGLEVICARIQRVLETTNLPITLEHALLPRDGRRLGEIRWHSGQPTDSGSAGGP